jgi:hypothetical protein
LSLLSDYTLTDVTLVDTVALSEKIVNSKPPMAVGCKEVSMSTITTQRRDTTVRKPSEEDIRALAFDLYKQEGGGDPVKHWLKAEKILERRYAEASAPHGYSPPKASATGQSAQSPGTKRTGRF